MKAGFNFESGPFVCVAEISSIYGSQELRVLPIPHPFRVFINIGRVNIPKPGALSSCAASIDKEATCKQKTDGKDCAFHMLVLPQLYFGRDFRVHQ